MNVEHHGKSMDWGAPAEGTTAARAFDLASIWNVIRRRMIPILIALIVVGGLTVFAYLRARPSYTASARVGVDRQTTELVTVGRSAPTPTTDSGTVDTQVQILQSPAIAGAVVEKLGLANRVGFGRLPDSAPSDPEIARARAIDVIRRRLLVQREGESYAIMVSASGQDPALAASIVNAAVEAYVSGSRTERTNARGEDIGQIRPRLNQLRQEVIEAETAVAQYRASTNLVDLKKDSSAAQQAMSVLSTQLATAQADQAAAEARARAARGGALIANAGDSATLRALRGQQNDLQGQVRDLSGRYGANHPALQGAQRRLDEVNRQIEAENRQVISSVDAEAAVARQRTDSIQASIGRTQSTMLSGNNASVRLNELERNAESARGLYQAFLDRYRASLAAQGTERSDAYIISPATVPRVPDSPKRSAFIIGGLLAGVLAATLVALALELLERGFRSHSQVEDALGLRVIASVPDLKTVKGSGFRRGTPPQVADYLLEHPTSLFADSLRTIRTSLRLSQGSSPIRSLVVASSLPGEGKTTLAICLARSAALAGLKVVLVDCDLRRRTTSRNLASAGGAGLVDVLKGRVPIEDAVVLDDRTGAFLLPQWSAEPSDHDIIGSSAMEALLDDLTARFDLVILDTAPVVPVSETRAIAAMADATILGVQWRRTPIQAAEIAVQELSRAGANMAGIVLTQVNVRPRAHNSRDIYYYQAYEAKA